MKFRGLTASDRPSIKAALADGTFKEGEIEVALELVDLALSNSPDYEFIVATRNDSFAGYVCFGKTPMTEGTFDLYWIVTAPAHRGNGVASALITEMETELRKRLASGVRVETSETESYGGARKLYDKLNYPQASLLEDFYGPGDGLITYYKTL